MMKQSHCKYSNRKRDQSPIDVVFKGTHTSKCTTSNRFLLICLSFRNALFSCFPNWHASHTFHIPSTLNFDKLATMLWFYINFSLCIFTTPMCFMPFFNISNSITLYKHSSLYLMHTHIQSEHLGNLFSLCNHMTIVLELFLHIIIARVNMTSKSYSTIWPIDTSSL